MRKRQERRDRRFCYSEKGFELDHGYKQPVTFGPGVMRLNLFVLYSALRVKEKEEWEYQSG